MMLQAQDNVAIKELVSRLDLESYKSVIKGLTQFGDRRQGTAEIKRLSTGLSNNFRLLVAPTRNVSLTPTTPSLALQDEGKARPNQLT